MDRALGDEAEIVFVIVRYRYGDYKTEWKISGRDLFSLFSRKSKMAGILKIFKIKKKIF